MSLGAYVLITSEAGAENDVFKEVRKKDGVVSADKVYGVCDVVAKVQAESIDALKEKITCANGVRSIKNIRESRTLIFYKGFTKDKDGKPIDV